MTKARKPEELNPKMVPESRRHVSITDAWWYEDRRGVEVCVETRDEDGFRKYVGSVRIPWVQLLAAAQRSSGKEVIVREKAKTTKRKS